MKLLTGLSGSQLTLTEHSLNGREIGMTTVMVPLDQGFLGSGKVAIALINGGKVTFLSTEP